MWVQAYIKRTRSLTALCNQCTSSIFHSSSRCTSSLWIYSVQRSLPSPPIYIHLYAALRLRSPDRWTTIKPLRESGVGETYDVGEREHLDGKQDGDGGRRIAPSDIPRSYGERWKGRRRRCAKAIGRVTFAAARARRCD